MAFPALVFAVERLGIYLHTMVGTFEAIIVHPFNIHLKNTRTGLVIRLKDLLSGKILKYLASIL